MRIADFGFLIARISILLILCTAPVDAGVFDRVFGGGGTGTGASVSDETYNATTWNGVTTDAPSKNAVRDLIETGTLDNQIAAEVPVTPSGAMAADDVQEALQEIYADKESATSNDFDPDRLAGDTTDDNMIDPDLITPQAAAGVAVTPTGDLDSSDVQNALEEIYAEKESATSDDFDPDRLAGDSTDDNKIDATLLRATVYAGAPTANDDTGDGYTVGWTWIDTTTACKWIAKDVTLTAAIWVNQCRPPLQEDYILLGGSDGYAAPSSVLPISSLSDDVYFENATTPTKQMEFDLSGLAAHKITLTPKDKNYIVGEDGVAPAGASPTTDAAGEFAVRTGAGAASGVQFYGNASPGSAFLPAYQSKCTTIAAATTASDYMVEQFPYAITIRQARVTQRGATNVVGHFDECDSAAAGCAGIDGATDITATTTQTDDGTLSNPSIDANDVIQFHTTSVSGTNTDCMVCIYYTVN